MAYTIQLKPDGSVKYFTGLMAFDDIIKSECEIAGHSSFTSLNDVFSVFLNSQHPALCDAERLEVRAQSVGGFYSNPRIKFACDTTEEALREVIEISVFAGQTLYLSRQRDKPARKALCVGGFGVYTNEITIAEYEIEPAAVAHCMRLLKQQDQFSLETSK